MNELPSKMTVPASADNQASDGLYQRKAEAVAEVCACANLRRVTRIITRRFDEAMRSTGLRSTQMSILNEIARMGDAPVSQLAARLAMDASTLTRNLTPLEREGVIVAVKTQGGRRRRVRLTERGSEILQSAWPLWRQAQDDFEAAMGASRWAAMREGFAQLN